MSSALVRPMRASSVAARAVLYSEVVVSIFSGRSGGATRRACGACARACASAALAGGWGGSKVGRSKVGRFKDSGRKENLLWAEAGAASPHRTRRGCRQHMRRCPRTMAVGPPRRG